MSFGLKNAKVTYQRMAITLLHDMTLYVNDMIIKSKTREEHMHDLHKFFKRINQYGLRLKH